MQAAAGILLRDRDDQTEVRLGQLVLRGLIALGDAAGQIQLFLRRQQAHLADLLEVHPDGIVEVVFGGQLDRVDQLFLFLIADAVVHVHAEVVVEIQLQLRADDLDAHRVERIIDLLDLLHRQIQLFQLCRQLRRLNAALFFGLRDQRAHARHRVLRGLLCRLLCIFHICHVSSSLICAHAHHSLCAQTAQLYYYIPKSAFLTRDISKNLSFFRRYFSIFRSNRAS